MGGTLKQHYGIKITTILNAAEKLTADLDYLCSLIEQPDPEFPIADAVIYATAVSALSSQLDFITEDISGNDLSEDEEYVKLTQDEIGMLNLYTENAEDSIKHLEETCGISLRNN